MEQLLTIQSFLLKSVENQFVRYLDKQINWGNRFIGIKGPRGAGKTTLMLQRLKYGSNNLKGLYVSADHPYFYQHQLYQLGEEFVQQGGTHLFIDEVHKYPNWSRELKSLYDSFPNLHIRFSSSSALEIFRGESDLSRRVSVYELSGMSFREYLFFHHKINLDQVSLDDVLTNHAEIIHTFSPDFFPLSHFKDFLSVGYLPFSKNLDEEEYHKRLRNILNTTLESDLVITKGYSAANSQKMKRLLGTLAEIVPYEPNISELARTLGLGRATVMEYITNLQEARILNLLREHQKGMSGLRKPQKILLENPNLSFAFHSSPNIGTLRESFALSQLVNAGYVVESPQKGDLLVNGKYTLEIGGRKKGTAQINNLEHSYVLSDGITVGNKWKVPLFLLGLLY